MITELSHLKTVIWSTINSILICVLPIVILLSIGFYVAGCAENDSKLQEPETKDLSIIRRPEAFLITGDNNDEIEWHIQKVQRIHAYYTASLELVQGDAVLISGEARSKCTNDCSFFENESTAFILVDKQGNIYQQQAPVIEIYNENEGTRISFTVSFSSPPGVNEKARNWGNLMVEDPKESNRNLPGYVVDLSNFNQSL